APVPIRSSWTCSGTTRATSPCTRHSKVTSGRTSHSSWRSGERMIPSFYRAAPRRLDAIFPVRASVSSTRATSPSRPTRRRSRPQSATSSNADVILLRCCGLDSQPIRHPDQLGHRARAHLLHYLPTVDLDGDLADAELVCDLLVEKPRDDPTHHL